MERCEGKRTVALMNETAGIGGAEVLVYNLAVELRERGWRVVAVLPEEEDWLSRTLRDEGFPVHPFRIRKAVDLECVGSLARLLRAEGVQAIHSHEFAMAVYGTAVAHELRVPHVITMHGNQTVMDTRRRRMALRWAFSHSRAAVAVSRSTRGHMAEKLRIPPHRIRVVPNGVPSRPGDRVTMRRSLGVPPEEVVLLAAGSLVERKGFHVLVQALGMIHRGEVPTPGPLPAWTLLLAGEGHYQGVIEDHVTREGLGDHVRLLGYRLDIPDLQAAADVFVMPSLWEGLPLAVLEGMFAGNPIIATRTSGIPEAVDDGVEGLLVPPGEARPLALALARVLADEALRTQLGRQALERARCEFSIGTMTGAYEALYLP